MTLMNKKLQVFVSSTYTDLIEERQATVEAILDAGHIPAGMELFKAGKSQMQTIRKWIDDSDVYMLILGGRYGSLEPVSDKSYTHLEYEYALSKNMPVFAIVLDDSFLFMKSSSCGKDTIFEKENTYKYNSFKNKVESNIVKYVSNIDQISSVVHAQLNNISNDPDYILTGWVRNTGENDTNKLTKEINTLLKENNSLNKQIQKLQEKLSAKSKEQFGSYSFDEIVKLFRNKKFKVPAKFTEAGRDCTVSALSFFTTYFDAMVSGITNMQSSSDYEAYIFYHIAPFYISFDLLEKVKLSGTTAQRVQTTKLGTAFYAMLESKNMLKNSKFV